MWVFEGFRIAGDVRGQPDQPALEEGVQRNQSKDVIKTIVDINNHVGFFQQYSGFYTHNVSSALYGADRLLSLMGYAPTANLVMALDEGAHGRTVDQDAVVTVARDCVLAYVECQIVVGVMQGVSAQYPCTWAEVVQFRSEHVGTPEQAIRAIVYYKSQSQFNSKFITYLLLVLVGSS